MCSGNGSSSTHKRRKYIIHFTDELLRRIDKANSVDRDKLMGSVRELFNDNNLIETLFSNTDIYKYISAENYNYDMICRFLPTLIECILLAKEVGTII